MRKKVLVRGPALTASGYGEHARLVLRSLKSKEEHFDIFFENISWGQTGQTTHNLEETKWLNELEIKTNLFKQNKGEFDVSVQVTIPNEFQKLAPVNIGVTAGIETTKIAPQWIEKSMLMDKLVVPSEHAKYGFDNSTYKAIDNNTNQHFDLKNNVPVSVIHYPVKELEASDLDIKLDSKFNFLTVAQWGPRKNLENTIKWFVEEFKDEEVGLVVKTSKRKNNIVDRTQCRDHLERLLSTYPDRKCKVHLLHGSLTDEQMCGIYKNKSIKAIVTATHGEGYGLPLFEAVYNELPVVAPSWSGHVDFLYAPKKDKKGKIKNKPYFTKVDYDVGPVQAQAVWNGVLQADSQWCFPKEISFKRALREVYKNYGPKKSEAKKLASHVRENFSKEKIYSQFAELIYGEKLVSVALEDIPKISIVTSVYDGDDFIEGFLKDITSQTIFKEKCELVLINAKSPGNEDGIIQEYIEQFPENIKYKKLDDDRGIYGCWNEAIKMSTGDFVTNANIDDRKFPTFMEDLAKALVSDSSVDVVYADNLLTQEPNETWENNTAKSFYPSENFSLDAMLRGNPPHCMPMWRKSLHDKHGYFSEEYRSASDWDFWLRCAFDGVQMKKVNKPLGLYFFNPKGMSTNQEHDDWKRKEEKEIFKKYLNVFQERSHNEKNN